MPTWMHGSWSSGTARQFCDLLVERERSELQALHRGQIGEYRVRDLLHRESATDRHDCGLDAVGPFRGKDMGAEQSAATGLCDELDDPAGDVGLSFPSVAGG